MRGVIRPVDLDPTNSSRLNRIAQMEIQVNGKGVIERLHPSSELPVSAVSRDIAFLNMMSRFRGRYCIGIAVSFGARRLRRHRAVEGTGFARRRARQSVDRLRHRSGAAGNGRPPTDAVHRAESRQYAAANGRDGEPQFILVRNTAAAMVTATLPPFAQPGSQNRCHGVPPWAMPPVCRAGCF